MQFQPTEILQKYWGYSAFRPLQEDIINSVMAGKDVIALLPTGGGKSLCYQVPGLCMNGLVVVVTPLIALMKDQVQHLVDRGISALAIHSGMTFREIDRELDYAVEGKYKFLYVSPERLQTEMFVERFKKMAVSFLAVDEAHCISQWGYDFRPVYLKIAAIKEYKPDLKCLALTATAVPEVIQDIGEKLEMKKPVLFQKSFSRENLVYAVIYAEDKLTRMLELLQKSKGSAIIYTRNRKRTKELSEFFNRNGIASDFYHAGLEPKIRDEKQMNWMHNKFPLMVCTNAFGMGIDKPDVRLVMHYDMPDSPEAYFQEAGRAGRDGRKAYSFLFWSDSDLMNMEKQFSISFPAPEEISRVLLALFNHYNVAYGSGEGAEYSFDLNEFCRKYNFTPQIAFNSIKFLEKEDYLIYSDHGYEPSKIIITSSKSDFYHFMIREEKYEEILKQLLRTYPGIMEDYVVIDINNLAGKLGKSFTEMEKIFYQLQQMDILDYCPANELPKIIFTTNRIANDEVKLSKKIYGFLKTKARERIDAMFSYVSRKDKCRSRLLLEYFDERESSDCGSCDVCKNMDVFYISDVEFKSFLRQIKTLKPGISYPVSEFYRLNGYPMNKKYKQMVRYAVDNAYLTISESGGLLVSFSK